MNITKVGTVSLVLASVLFAQDGNSELKSEVEALKKELAALKKKVDDKNIDRISDELTALKTRTLGDNIKFSADLRAAYDYIEYEHADGTKSKNTDLMTNRLWLGMEYAPRDDLSFLAQLSYNKAYGDSANHAQANVNPGFANFDWVTNENALDNDLKVKQAYFIYFGEAGDVDYTASFGRRPSTNGYPMNLREDDDVQSPLGHGINVEFDGASFGFDLSQVSGVSGMYFKICLGRGLTNAKPRFEMDMGDGVDGADYAMDESYSNDVDLYGFIFTPWSDGQYTVRASLYRAENLIGFRGQDMQAMGQAYQNYMMNPNSGDNLAALQVAKNNMRFYDMGNYMGGAITAYADGIGFMINDFLDNTKVFASYAFSQTDSNHNGMLGVNEDKFGSSIYLGAQFPCLLNPDNRIGIEYNHGSKYWRSMTYAEDTMIGSKIAARGDAYEAYYFIPIFGDTLTAQLRYTYIDYEYTGSNGFFGAGGAPMTMAQAQAQGMNPVDKATDFRAYLRYRY